MKQLSLLLLFLLIAFVSCNKDYTACKSCSPQGAQVEKSILFKTDSKHYQLKTNIYEGNFQDKKNVKYSLLIGSTTSDLFKSIKEELVSFDIDINKNYALTFYFDSNKFINENEFSIDEIQAISIFEERKNNIFHRLIKKNDEGKFEEIKLLSCFAKISTNHMTDILLDVLETKNSGSYILIYNKELSSKYKSISRRRDNWRASLKHYKSLNFTSGLKLAPDPGNGEDKYCEKPCDPYEPLKDYDCDPVGHNSGAPECVPTCGASAIHDKHEISQEITTENLTLQKRFEVEFLSNSEFGLNYIDYYNLLSGTIPVTDISLSTGNKIFNLFSLINPSISYLLDSNNDISNSNYIPITTEIKDLAIDIIEDLKLITNDSELLTVLDLVKQDFIDYENKPFSYIIASCCN